MAVCSRNFIMIRLSYLLKFSSLSSSGTARLCVYYVVCDMAVCDVALLQADSRVKAVAAAMRLKKSDKWVWKQAEMFCWL